MTPYTDIPVCHLTSVHPPFDIRIFYKECQSLVNAGYKVSLIAPAEQETERMGVKVIPISLPKSRLKRMLIVNMRMFRLALKQKARIYHFHDPELMPCGVLLRCCGKKVIFDIHENVGLSIQNKAWLSGILKPLISGVYYLSERLSILFYNQLILAEASYQQYYPKKKSTLVLNYPIYKEIEERELSEIQPVKLIYSGVIHELRGVWEMLSLLKLLRDEKIEATLTLVGEIRPATLKSELITWLYHQKLSDKVIMTGKVDYLQVTEFLNGADVGLSLLKPIPNYTASLPTKIFEYMQHGLPVIANNFALLKQYVVKEKVGICVDITHLENDMDNITELLTNKVYRKKIGEKGKKLIRENWNWATQETKLLKLYNQLSDVK